MAGRKVWTQETLSVPDMQEYLQDQVLMSFPTAAARAAAVPDPTEGMFSTLDDTDALYRHNGVTWVRQSNHGIWSSPNDGSTFLVTIAHGLGKVPRSVDITPGQQASEALNSIVKLLLWDVNELTFSVRVYRHDGTSGAAYAFSTWAVFWWSANA